MGEKFIWQICFYKNFYLDFYKKQHSGVQKKLDWTLQLIASLERIPVKYFKRLEGTKGLYEIRVETEGNIFRVFCFFDDNRLIILLNGFQKKDQKIPHYEIEYAEKLRKQYYHEKKTS